MPRNQIIKKVNKNNKKTTTSNKIKITSGKNNIKTNKTSGKSSEKSSKPQIVRTRLDELKDKTHELENNYKELLDQIKLEKTLTLNDAQTYRDELSSKTETISKLSKQQQIKLNKMFKLQKELDEQINKVNLNKAIKKNKKLEEEDQIKSMNAREKFLDSAINLNKAIENSTVKEIMKLSKNSYPDMEQNLTRSLDELKLKISKLELEVNKLKKIESIHNSFCNNRLKVITNEKIILKNEIRYNKRKEKQDKNNQFHIKLLKEDDNALLKKARIFSKKNSKSLDMKIKYIKTNESIEIEKKLTEIKNAYLSNTRVNTRSTNTNKANNENERALFSDSEKKNLEKIIPKEFLNICMKRFVMLDEKRKEMIDKISTKEEKDLLMLPKISKVNEANLEINNNIKHGVKLKEKYSKNNKLISDYHLKIKRMNLDIYMLDKKYKKILDENTKLKEKFKEFAKLIKKGKLYLKENTNLNSDNIEAIDKYGDDLKSELEENINYINNKNNSFEESKSEEVEKKGENFDGKEE